MSTPAPLGMFIVGFIIFALYIWGLLTMIYRGHKQQREEFENDPEIKAYFRSLERKKILTKTVRNPTKSLWIKVDTTLPTKTTKLK